MKFNYAYQHNNGTYVYESIGGKKVFNYNNRWFKSMSDVNEYINTTGITLKRKNHNIKSHHKIHDTNYYKIRIQEYRDRQYK